MPPGDNWGLLPVKYAALMGVSAIAFAATGPVAAADLPFKAPVAVPVVAPGWGGAYVGIAAGGTFGHSDHFVTQPAFSGPTTVDGYNIAGGLIGGTAGYNVQSGPWVYGVEGDLSFVDASGGVNNALPVFNPTTVSNTLEHWLATGRGRLGWTTPANVLLYGTGGFAVAGVEATIVHPDATLSDTNTRWGWTVGAGAEAMLAPHWSAKAEYLYVKLQDASYFPNAQLPTFIPRSNVPLDQHVFRFGLNYHFGEAAPVASSAYAQAPLAGGPPRASWAGLYLGGEAGGGFGPSNAIGGGPGLFGPLTRGYNITGALAGGTIGYNLQSGPWVYGAEGDFSWADLQGQANNAQPNTQAINVTKEHWLGTGRGRLGWTTPDNILLYVTGGFAVASVEADIVGNVTIPQSQTNTRWGGAVGAGMEMMVARSWSAKAEYLFVDLAKSTYFSNPPPNFNIRADVPVEEHIFRFGLNYHFGAL